MWWIERVARCVVLECCVQCCRLSVYCRVSIWTQNCTTTTDAHAHSASLACTAKSLSRYIHSTLWASLRRLRFRRQRIQKIALIGKLLHHQASYQLAATV